jgi:hypothetical protein
MTRGLEAGGGSGAPGERHGLRRVDREAVYAKAEKREEYRSVDILVNNAAASCRVPRS